MKRTHAIHASDKGTHWQSGQSAALVALLTPVMILAVAVVVDVGHLYQAKRWGQSIVDSASANGALALDPIAFQTTGPGGNRVRLAAAEVQAAACGQWFTQLRANGGALTVDQVPMITGCSATAVGDRGVRVTANVVVPVMFPGLYQAYFGGSAPAGSVAIPLVAESEFVFGITEAMAN